jgi:serine/threonine-protein kinase HipA
LIADSLPDAFGSQIIYEWFASRGLSDEQITPLDYLCYVGKRAMGALEFQPSKEIPGLDQSTRIYIDELTALAEEVFKNRLEFQSRLQNQDQKILDILKVGTSAVEPNRKRLSPITNRPMKCGRVKFSLRKVLLIGF